MMNSVLIVTNFNAGRKKAIKYKKKVIDFVLADDVGIFGSSMSDSTRAMVTDSASDILVVVYCFENDIELETLLCEAEKAFVQFAGVYDIDTWIA
mgnify:CR=1 FL=1